MHCAQWAQVGQVRCQGLSRWSYGQSWAGRLGGRQWGPRTGRGSTHLHVANHVAPQDGCQLVTVVFVVQPDLAVRRQGLQGRVCGPQHGEGPM